MKKYVIKQERDCKQSIEKSLVHCIFREMKGKSKMDFYKVIEKRRTIRDFQNVVIPADAIERIIEAGLKAATNDHMRD